MAESHSGRPIPPSPFPREKALEEVLNLMPDSALLADSTRRAVYANAAFTRLTGYDVQEVLGRNCRFLHGPDTQPAEVDQMKRALGEGVPYRGVVLNYRKDGTPFWNELSITPIRGGDGSISHYVGIQHDITERRAMEASLLESEERFRRMANDAPVMIWLADREGRRNFFNDTWQRYTGRPEGREAGEGWVKGLHPEDVSRVVGAYRTMVSARQKASLEYRLLRNEGNYGWVYAQWRPLTDPDGTHRGFIGCCMDITETRLAREERGLIERRLQDARRMESLGVLAGGIAHDFNNLLTGIIGNHSLAMMELPEDSPAREFMKEIQVSATKAADLCRQMLAFSGHGRFMVRNTSLIRLLQDLHPQVQAVTGALISLKLELPKELPAVSVDAGQVRQLVMNLVINAVEAIGSKSGNLVLRAGLGSSETDGRGVAVLAPRNPGLEHVFIEVVDDGPGIRGEDLDRIFEPFFTTKFTGRGLGLPAVLGIVRGHGGGLRVHSVPGRGTAFRASFPCALDAEGRLVQTTWTGSGRILVVDDEETVRSLMSDRLGNLGFEVQVCGDGLEALRLFEKESKSYALVVLDLTMPLLDGFSVFEAMRRMTPDVRVLLISGFSEAEATLRFQGRGLSGYLQKPFGHDQLLAAVRRILEPDKSRGNGSHPPFAFREGMSGG